MGAKAFAPKTASKANPFAVKKSDNGKPANPFTAKKHSVTRSGHDYHDPTGLVITKLREIDGRYWVALITYKGTEMEFHNRFGSWMVDVNEDNTEAVFSRDGMHGNGRMRDALPYVAALLSEKIPKPVKPTEESQPKKGVKNPWKQLSKKQASETKSSSKSDQAGSSKNKRSRSRKAAGGRKATGRAQRTQSKK